MQHGKKKKEEQTMRNALSKVTAWVLTFMMLFTALPVNIIAEGVQPQGIVEERSVDVPAPQQNEEEVSPASAPSEQESIKEQTPVEPQSVIPDDAFYRTYVFMAEEQEVARQIVKNGDTLLQPAAPAKEGYRFDGWYAGESRFTGFGVVTGITATETVTLTAAFTDVFYVFFKNTNGAVVATRSGRNGETISTSGVSFPVAGDEAITGWLLNGIPVDSVTLDGADVTLTAQVSKGFWITFDSKGGSYVAPAFYAQGQTAAAPAAPARPGYVFNGWFTEAGAAADFAAITENTTLVAGWKAGTASYTVIHFLENADDDGYSSKDIETRTGATGSQTAAAAKSYTGFTAQTITQATIAGDGSTIVKVYYTRNVYEVKFYSNSGWISESQEYTSLRITAKYGANISDKWPTYNGSNSWATSDGGNTYQVNIQTMPLGGTSFYGPKTGSGSETAYYYTEILPGESGDVTRNGVTYKLHHKDTSPGTGYTVTKEDKYPITGFTYKEGTRNGSDYDNARFYYTRNSYQIKFINGGSVDKTESRKFQQSIADAEYTPTAPAGKEGYIFAGWYDNEQGEGEQFAFAGKTMPAQNITLYAKWVAPVHTVTFYQEDKVTVVKAVAGIPHGTAMENGDIPAYTPAEGYAFLGWVMEDGSPFNPSMLITRDYHIYARVGSLNAYTVTYDANGGTGDVPVDDGRYAEGAAARVLSGAGLTGPADKPQFLGWALSAEASAPDYYPGSQLILGRENVTLYAVWGVKENTVSLTYHSNFGTDATYTVEALAVNGRVEVLSYDTTGLPARQGYNFLGWSTSASGSVSFAPGSSLRVNAGGSNDLYAVWEPAADTPYRVETYYQQLDGSYLDDPHHAEIRKGTTGTPVSVTEKDKLSSSTDYVFDEGYAGNVLSGVVAADGSLKLKLYFKLNTAPYTIHHYLKGTTVQVAADQTGRLVIGSTLTANAAADLYAEYAAATVNVYDPGRRITITAGNNEIIVYYTLPLTLTAGSAEKVYDGTPLTDGTVTVSEMGFAQGEGADYSVTGSQLHKGFSANAFTYTLHENTLEENYLIKTVPGTLTVTARPLTITAGSASKQYDGTPLARNSYTSEGLAAGDAIQTVTVTGTITYTGSVPNVPSDAVIHNGAGEDVTGDYEITYNNGTLTITVNEKILKVEANSNSWKYDGENHRDGGYTVIYDGVSYTVAAGDSLTLPTGDKVTVTITAVVKNVSDTAAGNNAIVKLDLQHADQYKIKEEKDGTLTITARKLTLTSGSDEKEYDGTPLTSKVVDVTGDGFVKGEGAQFDVTGSQTEAGESDNTFTYTLNRNTLAENYEITPVLGSLTVTRRGAGEKKVKIIANSYTVEYDGRFHGANGYTTEYLAPGHKVKKLILAGGRTDAGEYPGEFVPYDAAIVDANGNDVTHNYVITYVAGDLTITKRGLDPKNPVIVRADNSEVEYDGQPHGYVGHTASNLAEGHSVQSVESSFTATEAGYYETMIDVSDAVIVDAKGNDVTRNYAITYIFGNLRITKRGAGERKVLIIARDNTVEYDGQPHGQNGIDTDYLAPGHRVADVTIDGEKINAGRYAALLYPYDAVIVDAEGNDVTHNYKLTYVKGTLEITPYAGEVVVTITGNHDRVHYDGEEHTVSGYTVDIDTALYTEADFRFKGTASVTKVYPGTYAMGLQEKDFVNLNENFANVKFVVTDGYLDIYTKKFMVAWMYDTNQMVNGSQPSEAFTAMTDYIHRKDVSLVLHTGNMVENAADAGQWKVFNDAMQKLYDDAGKDVLMVAGEKEAAAGSLFLQQPVREGFDEKDLFEGGKGFVYRFRIGDKRMILVGLGEDAMTEEGLKWAKERFDSDKKAVGILMVHTYLLADMTQKQKIADSALKLEENVVKPCSNVRLVLSSNAGYASHHYFYYGMRKTTAINVDIEAAAKEGYFTMLTFDKDFHYVAVNSLSPYRNDYIYNDEKAELERYHLGELY